MLKRKAINKIILVSIILILFLFFTFILNDNKENKTKNKKLKSTNVYLVSNDYVIKTSMYINKTSLEEKIKKYVEAMIKENSNNILLPDSFTPIIPAGTKLIDVKVLNDIVQIYFSKEFENAKEKDYEKILECITYTVLEENEIHGIEIYSGGNMIKYIPKTSKLIPTLLTKDYGINKKYEIRSNKDIIKVIELYYMSIGDKTLMLPVTIYKNDTREKVEIIFDDLTSFIYYNDLISYVDSNIKLEKYEIGDVIKIYINKNKLIKEEENQILYSIFYNYNSNRIIIYNDETKILEKDRKDLEK